MFFTENATNLIEKIKQTGFLSNINPIPQDIDDRITKIQLQAGFPIKKPAAIGFVAIWNILFLYDFANFFVSHKTHFPLGIGAKSALGFILIICILLLMSESFRKFILKDGRSIDDIKKFIVFTIFGLGFLFLVLSLSAHIL